MDAALSAFLAKRRADQEAFARTIGVALVDDPYILSRASGGGIPCLPDGLTAGYGRAAKRLGIAGHFHGCGTLLLRRPSEPASMLRPWQARLGHADARSR